MAQRFLSQFEYTLADAQKDELKKWVDEKTNKKEIRSVAEARTLFSEMIQRMEGEKPIFKPIPAGLKISSTDYNTMIREILIDLKSLFSQSNVTDVTISAHQAISKDNNFKIQEKINLLEKKKNEYKAILDRRNTANNTTEETFHDFPKTGTYINNIRTEVGLDRLEITPATTHAITFNRCVIELFPWPTTQLTSRTGTAITSKNLSIMTSTGGDKILGGWIWERFPQAYYNDGISTIGFENITHTFPGSSEGGQKSKSWLEIIGAPYPLTNIYENKTVPGIRCNIDFYFTNSSKRRVGEIDLTPISTFPMYLYRIQYKDTTTSTTWKNVIGTDGKAVGGEIFNRTRFCNFLPFWCAAIRFQIGQQSCDYVGVNVRDSQLNEYASRIATREHNIATNSNLNTTSSVIDHNEITNDPQGGSSTSTTETRDKLLKLITLNEDTQPIRQRMFVYTLGCSKIHINDSWVPFDSIGEYMSPVYTPTGSTILGAKLEVDDYKQAFWSGGILQCTTIEYFLRYTILGGTFDVPILPWKTSPNYAYPTATNPRSCPNFPVYERITFDDSTGWQSYNSRVTTQIDGAGFKLMRLQHQVDCGNYLHASTCRMDPNIETDNLSVYVNGKRNSILNTGDTQTASPYSFYRVASNTILEGINAKVGSLAFRNSAECTQFKEIERVANNKDIVIVKYYPYSPDTYEMASNTWANCDTNGNRIGTGVAYSLYNQRTANVPFTLVNNGQQHTRTEKFLPGSEAYYGNRVMLAATPTLFRKSPGWFSPPHGATGVSIVTVNGKTATNMTDTSASASTKPPRLNTFINNNWEFYVYGNTLVFNDPNIASRTVDVTYGTLIENLRLRILLRSNNTTITPRVNWYKLTLFMAD